MRKIIHVDMDCFFAAVEMRDNPALRDIPIAIGGSRERRGVISTANYPARKFGVRSAMPTGMALKLCPHLTLLPGRYEAYKEASRQIQAIFSRYTSLIEPLSLDEAYLDVTDSTHCHGSATLIAQEIRQTIFNELQLTASAGIAPVKFLAKIASDLNKPNGQYVITPADVPEYPELERRLAKVKPDLLIARQGIKLKFNDFQQTTQEHVWPRLNKDDLITTARKTWDERRGGRGVRLVGLHVTLLDPQMERQLLLGL